MRSLIISPLMIMAPGPMSIAFGSVADGAAAADDARGRGGAHDCLPLCCDIEATKALLVMTHGQGAVAGATSRGGRGPGDLSVFHLCHAAFSPFGASCSNQSLGFEEARRLPWWEFQRLQDSGLVHDQWRDLSHYEVEIRFRSSIPLMYCEDRIKSVCFDTHNFRELTLKLRAGFFWSWNFRNLKYGMWMTSQKNQAYVFCVFVISLESGIRILFENEKL
jgi:hypothetical protein